jgi:hypothetical protein
MFRPIGWKIPYKFRRHYFANLNYCSNNQYNGKQEVHSNFLIKMILYNEVLKIY